MQPIQPPTIFPDFPAVVVITVRVPGEGHRTRRLWPSHMRIKFMGAKLIAGGFLGSPSYASLTGRPGLFLLAGELGR